MGKRITTKDQLATFFMSPDGSERGYVLKPKHSVLAYARPGGVYVVELNDEGKLIPSSGRFKTTEQSERVDEWVVESEACEAQFESKRRAKREQENQTIKNLIEPIRTIYHQKITPAQRRAVLMSVMEAITR